MLSEEFSIVVLVESEDNEVVVVSSLVEVSTIVVDVLKLEIVVVRDGVIEGLGSVNLFEDVVDSVNSIVESLNVVVCVELIVDSVDDKGGVIGGTGIDVVVSVLDSLVVSVESSFENVVLDSEVLLSVDCSVVLSVTSEIVVKSLVEVVGSIVDVEVDSVEDVTLGKDSVVVSIVLSTFEVDEGTGSPKSGGDALI